MTDGERAMLRVRAIEMRQAGETCADIAETLGVTSSIVSDWTKLYAPRVITDPNRVSRFRIAKINECRASGMTIDEIARLYKMTPAVVETIVAELEAPMSEVGRSEMPLELKREWNEVCRRLNPKAWANR